jgi:DNA-binding FadR family transcriptional regulator
MKKVLFEPALRQEKKYIEIIQIFKNKIISGELKPGDKLPTEVELMEQLGMSRTPIREAIKILEALGIIEIKRGEGMFLRKKTSTLNFNPLIMALILQSGDIQGLIEFRQYFEHMIIELIWKHYTDEDYQKLLEQYTIHVNTTEMDVAESVEQDIQFHYVMLEITRNPFIIEIGKTVYELFRNKMELIERKRGRDTITHKMYLKVIKDRQEKDFEDLKDQIARNYSRLAE